jgi:EmrB/QacA subfamily drug resistance transporter
MAVATTTAPATAATPTAYRWRWAALFVILAGEVMDLLDALVTTIAGPSIRRSLGGSESMIQWLGAGYTLAMAVGVVTGGRLGDRYGRRRMFLVGAAGFVVASLLSAVSQSPEMLIGARVLQGLFGAVMLPQGLGIIKEMFPPGEVGAAFGAFGPIMALSAVGGPILAGWLVGADLLGTGWRMIFLINLPIGLFALIAGARLLPRSRDAHRVTIDLTGVGILTAAALLIIYPLVQGQELGWPWWTFAAMGASVGFFALFGLHVSRVARRGGDPLVTPSLFRKKAFTGGLVAGTAFFSGLVGLSLVFSLYLQTGLGYSAMRAGLANTPQAAGMIIGFLAASAGLSQRLGRRLLHFGLAITAVGVGWFALALHAAGPAGVTPWGFAPPLALSGIGIGLMMAPFFDIALSGVDSHETGSASGSLNAVQQFGGALGIAILGTVFFRVAHFGPTGPVLSTVERAMQWTIAGELVLLAVTFAATFLLPKSARPEALSGTGS